MAMSLVRGEGKENRSTLCDVVLLLVGEGGGTVMLCQWRWGEVEVGNGNVLWGVHSW